MKNNTIDKDNINLTKDAKVPSLSKQKVRQTVNKTPSKRQIVSDYRVRKKEVFALEENNQKYLYFYPASDAATNSVKFYYLGGNSAIIYAGEYADRIGRKAKLRRDDDLGEFRFYRGVCAFSDVETIIEKLLALGGIKREPDHNGIIALRLPRNYTKTEIRAMYKTRETELEKVNILISPNIAYPEVNKQIIKLRKELPAKINRLSDRYFDTFGKTFFDALNDLCYHYTLLTRKRVDATKAGANMLIAVEKIFTCLSLINDCGVWEVSVCARIAETTTILERLIITKLLKKGTK